MESSDDSFAWTGASSDSEDSEPMAVEQVNNHIMQKYESDNNLKKKLHKQLFREHEPSDLNENEVQKKQKKKKKIKEVQVKVEDDELVSDDSGAGGGAGRVKVEPESDGGGKKRRRTTVGVNGLDGALDDKHGSVSHDDMYLELRVKQEQAMLGHTRTSPHATPIKKKKKEKNAAQVNNHSELEAECLNASISKNLKKSKRFPEQDKSISKGDCEFPSRLHDVKQEIAECESQRTKKRKSNQSRNSDVTDENDSKNMIIEDIFSAEETVVETRHIAPGHNQATTITSSAIDFKGARDKESRKSKKESSFLYSSKEFVSEDSSDDESTTTKSSNIKKHSTKPSIDISMADESSDSKNQTKKTGNRSIAKISDRLHFEDEDGADVERSIALEDTLSSRFRHFLKANPYLRSIRPKLDSDTLITKDDEVWILKCPHDVDIRTLKDMDLVLNSKCKVKVDGQTYDGTLENENSRVAILSVKHNTSVIKNIPLTGTINLRKRIPKVHFIEDNTISNNQTNFIPLPDTKCRHPLFGSDFKRRIKIPASVKVRLNATEEELPIRKKKKKHKRQQSPEPEPELQTKPEPEPEGELKRKKRKRKRSHDEEPAPRKTKRLKHDPEAADAWESEKAIEENLFNY